MSLFFNDLFGPYNPRLPASKPLWSSSYTGRLDITHTVNDGITSRLLTLALPGYGKDDVDIEVTEGASCTLKVSTKDGKIVREAIWDKNSIVIDEENITMENGLLTIPYESAQKNKDVVKKLKIREKPKEKEKEDAD